jgi:hypothetical protein
MPTSRGMKAIRAPEANLLFLPPIAAFDGAGGGVQKALVDVDGVALAAALGGRAGLDDLAAVPAGDDGVEGGMGAGRGLEEVYYTPGFKGLETRHLGHAISAHGRNCPARTQKCKIAGNLTVPRRRDFNLPTGKVVPGNRLKVRDPCFPLCFQGFLKFRLGVWPQGSPVYRICASKRCGY